MNTEDRVPLEEEEYLVTVPATITASIRATSDEEAARIMAWLLRRGAHDLSREFRGIDFWARSQPGETQVRRAPDPRDQGWRP